MTKEELKDLTLDELIKETQSLDNLIYEQCCFGTSDLRLLNWCLEELDRRGYKVSEDYKLKIVKK